MVANFHMRRMWTFVNMFMLLTNVNSWGHSVVTTVGLPPQARLLALSKGTHPAGSWRPSRSASEDGPAYERDFNARFRRGVARIVAKLSPLSG